MPSPQPEDCPATLYEALEQVRESDLPPAEALKAAGLTLIPSLLSPSLSAPPHLRREFVLLHRSGQSVPLSGFAELVESGLGIESDVSTAARLARDSMSLEAFGRPFGEPIAAPAARSPSPSRPPTAPKPANDLKRARLLWPKPEEIQAREFPVPEGQSRPDWDAEAARILELGRSKGYDDDGMRELLLWIDGAKTVTELEELRFLCERGRRPELAK